MEQARREAPNDALSEPSSTSYERLRPRVVPRHEAPFLARLLHDRKAFTFRDDAVGP
jgi:hypothetical protein